LLYLLAGVSTSGLGRFKFRPGPFQVQAWAVSSSGPDHFMFRLGSFHLLASAVSSSGLGCLFFRPGPGCIYWPGPGIDLVHLIFRAGLFKPPAWVIPSSSLGHFSLWLVRIIFRPGPFHLPTLDYFIPILYRFYCITSLNRFTFLPGPLNCRPCLFHLPYWAVFTMRPFTFGHILPWPSCLRSVKASSRFHEIP
jgi:hypothetical protein